MKAVVSTALLLTYPLPKPEIQNQCFRMRRPLVLTLIVLLQSVGVYSQGVTYYSQGSLAADNISSWNSNRAGGGSSPLDFSSGDVFVIQNSHAMFTSGSTTWTLSGDGSSNSCGFTIENGGSIQVNKGMSIIDALGNSSVTMGSSAVFIDNTGSATFATLLLVFSNPFVANYNLSPGYTVKIIKDISGTRNNISLSFSNLDIQADVTFGGTNNSISINNNVNIKSGKILNFGSNSLSGSFSTSGNGTLKTANTSTNPVPSSINWNFPVSFFSTSAQSIPSGNYYKLINEGTATNTTSGNITITGFLTINSGTLNIGNSSSLILKSTSINNTAQIDQVGGAISYSGSGAITVERYIPDGNRAYRDLGAMVYNTSKSVFDTWQEGGASTSGYGVTITGKANNSAGTDPVTGFDYTGTGNPSMYSYINGVWNNVSSTKGISLNPFQGYRIFVRGDRSINLYQNPQPTTMNGATTLRTTGKLITGTVTYNTSGVSNTSFSSGSFGLNSDVNGFSIVANPYAAIINWSTIGKTNLTGTFWYFDPTIGSNGAYVTWNGVTNSNGASGVNQYIQPGQAFFVQGNGAGAPVLTIQESDKTTGQSLTSIFGSTPTIPLNKLGFTLWRTLNNKLYPMDGSTAVFASNYSNAVSSKEDADKFYNSGENLAIYTSNHPLSIDCRQPVIGGDTIQLRFWSPVVNTNYTLRIDTKLFTYSKTLTGYLLDKFTNTLIPLKDKDTLDYTFKVTSDTNTYLNRFAVFFSKNNVSSLSIAPSVSIDKSAIDINWTTKGEYDLITYSLERSTDSINFVSIATLTPKNSGETVASYTWADTNPAYNLKYYYRIKATNIFDQEILTSAIVSVDFSKLQPQLTAFPNPVRGTTFNLEASYLKPGVYLVEIFTQSGNKILNKNITVPNAISSITSINLDSVIPGGTYMVKISSGNSVVTNFRILKL